MKRFQATTVVVLWFAVMAVVSEPSISAAIGAGHRLVLREGWAIQSSADLTVGGETISTPAFTPVGWHRATVPTTVLAALVADGTYPDPHFGTNLRAIPGADYPVGENFSGLPMSEASPFRVPWCYRVEFTLPGGERGRRYWLRFDGINYRADVWLNGSRIADAASTAGAFRVHEFDVTEVVRVGGGNVLAVEVSAPRPDDLAITFVDWNPMPPDKLMGIFRDVAVSTTGPVALRAPQVLTRVRVPALDRAELTVKVLAENASARAVHGILRGRAAGVRFAKEITLAAGERRELRVTPDDQPALFIANPRLWWPWELGTPTLHRLEAEFVANGQVSDRTEARFGIREFGSELTAEGYRVFTVNGRRIFVRGAGYAPEMLLRETPERQDAELRYVRDLNLNTVRLEGKLEDDHFFDLTDAAGILVMAGWCCCDRWEQWREWNDEDHAVAAASLRDQILRLRGRASLLVWLSGSDNPPPPRVERMYLAILRELEWVSPVLSSASERATEVSGPTGVKMRGPYDYEPPEYWRWDTSRGGAFGFATEITPGPAIPPVESLRSMLPVEHLWPIDSSWTYHAGGGVFANLGTFTAALEERYGKAGSVADYARKAQAAAYESHRAMFEAYRQNKYRSTGVIQWMLNNAWPSLIWHLYDFYLRPGGSYFGVKKACDPLHVQVSVDDRWVWVVSSLPGPVSDLVVTARVFDLASVERFHASRVVSVSPDSSSKVLEIPELAGLGPASFVSVVLATSGGRGVSTNFYWLSSKPDVLDGAKAQWYLTPIASYADLTALSGLPAASVKVSARHVADGDAGRVTVTLRNGSSTIALLLHVSVLRREDGAEVLPILWEDNYVSLLPGETREIGARFRTKDAGRGRVRVRLEGWNVASRTVEAVRRHPG